MVDLKDLINMVNPDKDGDGKGDGILGGVIDAVGGNDAIGGLLNSFMGGGDKKDGGDDLISSAIKGLTQGGANNAAQDQLTQNGISADSLSGLLGGLLGSSQPKAQAQTQSKGLLDDVLGGALAQLTGSQAAPKQNQGNNFIDMIMKILVSKLGSDVLTNVVKSFTGNMLGGLTNGIAAGDTPSVDVMGQLQNALTTNNVDDATTQDVLNTVVEESKGL